MQLFRGCRVNLDMFARSLVAGLLSLAVLSSGFAQSSSPYSVEIDLQEQMAFLIQDGRAVLSTHRRVAIAIDVAISRD